MADPKIDKNLSADIIAHMKRTKEQMDAIRAQNDAELIQYDNKIASARRMDKDGIVEGKDGKGRTVRQNVWDMVRKNYAELLHTNQMKGYDNYSTEMMNLIGTYIDLNAALFYSAGEFLPAFHEIFRTNPVYGFLISLPQAISGGASELGKGILNNETVKVMTNFASENVLEPIIDFANATRENLYDWSKAHNSTIFGYFTDKLADMLTHDVNDVHRTLVVQDLLDLIDYSNTGKHFFAPLSNNGTLLDKVQNVLQPHIDEWLKERGYTKAVNEVNYKNGSTVLNQQNFKDLRFDDKGIDRLKDFISQEFAESFTPSRHLPRI